MSDTSADGDYDFDSDKQFWQRRPDNVRVFASADELYQSAIEAFDWIHSHPKRKQLVFHHKGEVTRTYETLERPFTFNLLAMVMGVSFQCLDGYRKREGFEEAMQWIDHVIYTQKFEGAAVGTLNANFIARDLGMADRSEVTGKNGGPLETVDLTDREKLIDEARRLGLDLEALGLGGST